MSIGPGANLAGNVTAASCPYACEAMCDPKYLPACSNDCVERRKCCSGGGGGDGPPDDGPPDRCGSGGPKILFILPFRSSVPSSPGNACKPPTGLLPGCVTLKTRISLFPEGCKMAGELVVGDVVLTRTINGDLASEKITELNYSQQPILCLETADGKLLFCSDTHEVMRRDNQNEQGAKIGVAELTLKDSLLTKEGTPVALNAISREETGTVVQISLEGPTHVYLSDGMWSHNKALPAE